MIAMTRRQLYFMSLIDFHADEIESDKGYRGHIYCRIVHIARHYQMMRN